MAWAFRQPIRTSDKFVLVSLCYHANEDTLRCFPSVETISSDCKLDPRSVHRSFKRLVGSGLMDIQNQSAKGLQIPSNYILNLDAGVPPPPRSTEPHQRSDSVSQRSDSVSSKQGKSGQRVRQIVKEQKRQHTALAEPAAEVILLAEEFESFWRLFPRQTDKIAAEREFTKALTLAPLSEIMDGVRRYTVNPPSDKKFWLGPCRWLKDQRWTDGVTLPITAIVQLPQKPRPGGISQEEAARLGL